MKWRNEQIYHLRQSQLLTETEQENYFKTTVLRSFEEEFPQQVLFSFLKDNICIGYGGLVHINWMDRNAELSFIMDTRLEMESFEEIWDNYLPLIEEVAFNELKFHKIFTYAFDLRPHLYNVLEKNGYIKEAILVDHILFKGNYKNVVIHRKLR
jgi:RimJ/RimL family protein N-acetyltransferase